MSPTAPQLRAARAWLDWSRDKAAHEAGLHTITVGRAERGDPCVSRSSLENLAAVYSAFGFVFGPGFLQRGTL